MSYCNGCSGTCCTGVGSGPCICEDKDEDMSNATTIWVASRSKHPSQALWESDLIEMCISGPNPREDAESCARDETMATDKETYLYKVEIAQIKGFKIHKEVHAFDPTK